MYSAFAPTINSLPTVHGSGHGLVFGMATPTNIKGGWSLDLGLIKLSGTNEVYELAGPALADLKKFVGKSVLIDGIIPVPKGKAYLKVISIKSVKPIS